MGQEGDLSDLAEIEAGRIGGRPLGGSHLWADPVLQRSGPDQPKDLLAVSLHGHRLVKLDPLSLQRRPNAGDQLRGQLGIADHVDDLGKGEATAGPAASDKAGHLELRDPGPGRHLGGRLRHQHSPPNS